MQKQNCAPSSGRKVTYCSRLNAIIWQRNSSAMRNRKCSTRESARLWSQMQPIPSGVAFTRRPTATNAATNATHLCTQLRDRLATLRTGRGGTTKRTQTMQCASCLLQACALFRRFRPQNCAPDSVGLAPIGFAV